MTHLIADSGSSKTSWLYIDEVGRCTEFDTLGINPVRDNNEQISKVLDTLPPIMMQNSLASGEGLGVWFYGAGCMAPYSEHMYAMLQRRFPHARIIVESDMLGAAHALLGNKEGIACILGTGSNSCLYDGKHIIENTPALGWILGDEGSGAVLGRNLISDLLKHQLSETLLEAFKKETGLTLTEIITKTYREPQANRFLASLVPFIGHHRSEPEMRQFIIDNLRLFFRRNIAAYGRPELPVCFVGGIAYDFRDELLEAARLEGFRLGKVLQRPIQAMADYILK
ncbi:MAG: ATPase [Bacteroidaceae bacterium]|nr:ATPase [Bacteroidaceae bacterium]